ncbi:Uncharacterised protein [Mycobacteroides abscessus subsp. massiliense]|nr:Uncharacterised protein [Mycobacteroides abscessus subsp. massiliense]
MGEDGQPETVRRHRLGGVAQHDGTGPTGDGIGVPHDLAQVGDVQSTALGQALRLPRGGEGHKM